MQIDFHHAVTYVLARLSGFPHGEARVVAYAAQYVDDSVNKGTICFENGETYDHIASSHETFDVANNRMETEDYSVWVPFHFLPGNNGAPFDHDPGVPPAQRLLCQPDSHVAQDMLAACKAAQGEANHLHRLGITTHVFADTFAHQRFAGIRHELNMASGIQLPEETLGELVIKGKADFVQLTELNLGHGTVATFPDLPFLEWSYQDNYGKPFPRKNLEIFMNACDNIFQFYMDYQGKDATKAMEAQDRELLACSLLEFTDTDGDKREARWMELLKTGGFTGFPILSETELDEIKYVPKGIGSWKWKALGTVDSTDSPGQVFPYNPEFGKSDWYHFHEALKAHRSLVLDTLIPKFQIPSIETIEH